MGSIVAELAEKLTSATNSFDIDEQTLYVNTSADTVGIGTNSPDGKLSVHQSGTGDIFNLYDGTTNILTVVDGGALTHNGTFTIGVDDTGYDVKFFGATATNGYMLWDQSADSLVLGSSSKLGIGITAPSEKLEVGGNIKIADGGTIGSATTAGAITIAQDGVVTLVDDLVIKDGGTIGSATTAAAITIAANGALTLSTAPAGFNYVATVAAAQTGSTDGIIITGSGTAAAGVTVAHADTSSQADVNNSGNSFIQDITLDTYGHITAITSATATDTDTTYSVATSSALGLVKIGYTQSGKNYPVQLSSEQAYVNVPWTDTNTTYSVATSSALGLVQIGYTESGKNYPVELSSNKMYVNVPWTDTTYAAGSGLSLSGTTLNVSGTISANVGTTTTSYSINGVIPKLPDGTGSYGSIYITGNSQHDTGSGNNNVVLQKSMVATLASTSSSYQNVIVGNAAGESINGGNTNTLVGYLSGPDITSGDNNTCIGKYAGLISSGPGGKITTGSNNVIIGDTNVQNAYIKVAWTTGSDVRDKTDIEDFSHGLEFVKTLRPVTYKWDNRSDYLTGDEPEDFDINSITRDGSKKRPQLEVGLIAQEVLVEENKIGYATDENNDLFVKVHNTPDSYGMNYERLTIPLINAVKELSAQVEELTTRVAALEG